MDCRRLAGLGISAHAGALLAHLENPEAGQFHRLAALQRLNDQFKRALDERRAFLAGEPHVLMYRFAKVGARQRLVFSQ